MCVCARARTIDGGGSGRLLDFTNDLLGYIVMICGSVFVKHGKRKKKKANKRKKGHGDFFFFFLRKRKEGSTEKGALLWLTGEESKASR